MKRRVPAVNTSQALLETLAFRRSNKLRFLDWRRRSTLSVAPILYSELQPFFQSTATNEWSLARDRTVSGKKMFLGFATK